MRHVREQEESQVQAYLHTRILIFDAVLPDPVEDNSISNEEHVHAAVLDLKWICASPDTLPTILLIDAQRTPRT